MGIKEEFGSLSSIRWIKSVKPSSDDNEWIDVLTELPEIGQKVRCFANKTLCCEIDMEPHEEHVAIFNIHESSWRTREDGTKYDITTYPSFDLIQDKDEMNAFLLFVSRWKIYKEED